MRTLELFSGTASFSKAASKRGHSTYTIDIEGKFKPDSILDIMDVDERAIYLGSYDVIWASPPCQSFSVAAIGKNWRIIDGKPRPISKEAALSIILLKKTIKIIASSSCRYWFIENPRGMMRKIIDDIFDECGIHTYLRHTVSYCQYGDIRQKPTDIWTNCYQWRPKPICSPKSSCHQSAPRGSTSGTQGIKGAIDRSVIPQKLMEEIVKASESI